MRALGGEIITISASSDTYINAMDISGEYGGGQNPLALKSDFIMSLCCLLYTSDAADEL